MTMTEVEENKPKREVKYFTKEDEEAWGGPHVYWSRVAESEGFDIDGIPRTPFSNGLMICYWAHMPEDIFVKNCAKLGIHRYNMLEGTCYKLHTLLKFNRLQNHVSSFYMTMVVHSPAGGGLFELFQGRVDERRRGILDLTCSLARLRDKRNEVVTTKKPFSSHFHRCAVPDSKLFDGDLPDWPSDDDLNVNKRFYVLTSSELQGTGWIYLYLKLLICANDRWSAQVTPDFMSKLCILKVVIETDIGDMKPPNERLQAKCANVYFMFKGLEKIPGIDEVGEHVERKAIVRRVLDSRFLTLVGKHWNGKDSEKPSLTLKGGGTGQSSRKRTRSS